MTVIIPERKLAFFTVPKIACSSIKTALFEVENGFPFRPFNANGVHCHIHSVAYPARPFEYFKRIDLGDYLKVALVRDPITRFLSCYSNRVDYYRELSAEHLGDENLARGLKPNPDIHEFIANFGEYRTASHSIFYHSAPMVRYLGLESSFFDHLFDLGSLSSLELILSEYLGQPITFPRIQTGGEKLNPDVLTKRELKKLTNFYGKDYECFSEFIALPNVV